MSTKKLSVSFCVAITDSVDLLKNPSPPKKKFQQKPHVLCTNKRALDHFKMLSSNNSLKKSGFNFT